MERVIDAPTAARAPADLTPLSPPEPGEPGGLPDDRTPVSEGPFTPGSAQGAANVVQIYFALLEAGKHAEAFELRQRGSVDARTFTSGFEKYREYHARIGAPGRIESAAESLFVELPVQIYGRLADGTEFNKAGQVRLKRADDIDGATADQLAWRITSSEPASLLQ
jgi:hypothetical protein